MFSLTRITKNPCKSLPTPVNYSGVTKARDFIICHTTQFHFKKGYKRSEEVKKNMWEKRKENKVKEKIEGKKIYI